MTEIAERKIYQIDTLPFALAFVGGPLVVTALTFWIYYIPVVALLYGGPIYVLVGLPTAIIHLRSNEGTVGSLVSLATTAVTLGAIPVGLLALGFGGGGGVLIALFVILLSYMAAASWSAVAAAIYNRLRSDHSRIPQHRQGNGGCFA